MRPIPFLSLALLSAVTSTLTEATSPPLRPRADNASSVLLWHVSNFTTGCSPGGCVYSFNIVGTPGPYTPGFNTTCHGTDLQSQSQPCTDKTVLSNITAETYPLWNVEVTHHWRTADNSEFWDIGQANVTASSRNFTIPVSQQYGVS